MKSGHHVHQKCKIQRINSRKQKQTPWLESTSELHRHSDRRLSAELVTIPAARGVSRSQNGGSPTAVISIFQTEAATFSFKWLLSCTHETVWTLIQTRYFSKKSGSTGNRTGISGSVAKNSNHLTTVTVE
jgi:hypothetical protein